jgi:hypothetical protein
VNPCAVESCAILAMVDDPQIDDPTTFSQWEPES